MPSVADQTSSLIETAAADGLGPLGLVQYGRSRSWVDDHNWWLINVEFQPSQRGKGCCVNVGEQHLWIVRDHLCFEDMERPLGGSTFVTFHGDDDEFAGAMASAVHAAASVVDLRRARHGDGVEALRRIAEASDDLNGGIAAAILGDAVLASERLGGNVHDSARAVADSYIGVDAAAARQQAMQAVATTRATLGLPAIDNDSRHSTAAEPARRNRAPHRRGEQPEAGPTSAGSLRPGS